MNNTLHIVIDTREQRPWDFGEYAEVSRGTICAGDYAVKGDNGFAIERKELNDYVGTVFTGIGRFNAELKRMEEMQFPAKIVIVEAEWMDVLGHKYNHPEIEPHAVLKRTAELMLDGVCVFFAGNPTAAAGLCWKLLSERKARLEDERDN